MTHALLACASAYALQPHGVARRVLIADTPTALKELRGAFAPDELEVLHATTFDEALKQAAEKQPDMIVLGYHFDEARPYRLVQELRAQDGVVPILLVRALSDPAASDPEAIRLSYQSLGVSDYLPLHEDRHKLGSAFALRRFAKEVRRWLGGS